MTSHLYDEMDIRRALKAACKEYGSQSTFATAHKLPIDYLSDVLKGYQSPGERTVRAVGFDRVTRFVRRVPSKAGLP